MSSSAVTLQCPACGGVFLTLQQGTGGAEICPHCSMSAPRGRYRSIESQSSPGARAMLPPRRPETAPGTTSQPVPVLTAAMMPEAVPAERPVTAPTTLPPVRPGSTTEPVSPAPPQIWQPPTPAPAATTEVNGLSMQLPGTGGTVPTAPVFSERVPIPPVPPGEMPLPSRVLQTLPTPTASTPAHQPASSPVASPFSVATGPVGHAPELAVQAPVSPMGPTPPQAHATWEPVQPPPQVHAPAPTPATISAPPAPAYEAPRPAAQPQYQHLPGSQHASYPAQLPVAYPPVPAPPPRVDPAAASMASPAQLWEAAVLQHHQQRAQDVSITPTGRELFPTGSVPTFQPPPPAPPLGPVTFGPLTPPSPAEAPPPAAEPALLPAPLEGGLPAPRTGGTVLPAVRSAPPAAPLHAYVAMPIDPAGEPLPPPQIGFADAPQQSEPPSLPAEAPAAPPASPFSMATTASPVVSSPLPAPSASTEPIQPPTPDFVAALEQARAQAQTSEPVESFFTSAEPPAGSSVFASTEPPAISGDPPPAFVPGPPTQGTSLLLGESTAAELHLPQHQHGQDLALVASKVLQSSGQSPSKAAPPAPRRRIAPWMAGLILGSLALGAGFHFLKDLLTTHPGTHGDTTLPSQVAHNSPTTPAPPAVPETKKAEAPATPDLASNSQEQAPAPAPPTAPEARQPAPTAPVTTAPAPHALPVPPMPPAPAQEEVRRAMPSNPETLSISTEDPLPAIAAKLMFGFDSASSPEERAQWIADPDKHSAAMEHLIRLRGGRLNTREVEPLTLPAAGPVVALPSGETVALFRVNSPASRGGAILRLHAQSERYLIDWPLFAQTYDNAFDRFVAANRAIPGKAEWYTVLCSLIGGADAKNATREPHLRLKVQGSLAETGITEAWVEKRSPAGKYLSGKLTPGGLYLIDLQFGASDAGSRRLMVLDCAATRGQAAQANANK